MGSFLTKVEVAARSSYYTGKPLESGGTSIGLATAPGVRYLVDGGLIKKGQTICDYGAGKSGRNANFLRKLGFKVYAYDPFNGQGVDGWEGVSNKKPTEKFDVCFTSYVLNVVPEPIETQIIAKCKRLGKSVFHITRNMDIYDTIKKNLEQKNKVVTDFFVKEFEGDSKNYTNEDVLALCYFGVQTSKGFQRIPELEKKGFKLLVKTHGYKIYTK